MASSYIVIAKRIQQAQNVSNASGSSLHYFSNQAAHLDTLLAIQGEWNADSEVDAADKNTLDAIFVTLRPQVETLLAKIDAGIAAATTLETNSAEE